MYFGESSPWSYLQLMRKVVEGVAGPSQFTLDPGQSEIVEPTLTVPETARSVQMLPEKKTAEVLVQCFFTNVCYDLTSKPISILTTHRQTAS